MGFTEKSVAANWKMVILEQKKDMFKTVSLVLCFQQISAPIQRELGVLGVMHFSTALRHVASFLLRCARQALKVDPLLLRSKCRAHRDLLGSVESFSSSTNCSLFICSFFQFFATVISATLRHLGSTKNAG